MAPDDPFSTKTGPSEPDWSEPPEIPGFRVIGERPIGIGGMGVVWEAEDELHRRVAIKTTKQSRVAPLDMERLRAEAQVLAALNHPHIVPIHEFGSFESKGVRRPFFAMKLISGVPLDQYVRTTQPRRSERVRILRELVGALASAHNEKIVHRDFKPGNVMIERGGRGYVLDFGIAGLIGADGATIGRLGGTLPWASPEQAEELFDNQGRPAVGHVERESRDRGDARVWLTGERISCVGSSSDVYSAGVVAYQLFHSKFRRPYCETSESWASRDAALETLRRRPLAPPDLAGRRLGRVILKALNVHPLERYTDAVAFLADIDLALAGRVTDAGPRHPLEHVRSYVNVHRVPLTIATLLAAGIAATSWQASRATHARDDANRLAEQKSELAVRESQARVRAEGLARSTDRAMDFLDQVIFSVDSYSARDQSINWEYVFKAAREKLPTVEGDARAEAIVLRAMGRIASNWGRYDDGAAWLARSAERWRQVGIATPAASAAGAPQDPRPEEAKTLNWLAWALRGGGKSREAVEAAQRAYQVARDSMPPLHADTLAYRFDWAKMRIDGGDQLGGTTEFVEALADISGKRPADYVRWLIAENKAIAGLARAKDTIGAGNRLTAAFAPLLDPGRPRIRGRIPWSLAQGGRAMVTDAGTVKLGIGALLFKYGIPLSQLPDTDDLRASGRVAVDVAASLADSVLPAGHPDIAKVRDVQSKLPKDPAR